MKFKREDFGVYTTLALFGAGVGLLIGTYLTSLLVEDKLIEVNDEKTHKEAKPKVTTIRQSKANETERWAPHNEDSANDATTTPSADGRSEKETRSKGGQKNHARSKTNSPTIVTGSVREDLEEALLALDDEYGVTSTQRQLVLSGVVSISDLAEELYGEDPPVDYGAMYEVAPDLDKIAKDYMVEANITISYDRDTEVRYNSELVYYHEDAYCGVKHDDKLVYVDHEELLGEDTMQIVMDAFLGLPDGDNGVMYVVNAKKQRQYAVTLASGKAPFNTDAKL